MRYASLVVVCLLSGSIAAASDETQKLLDGKRVEDVLQFSVTKGKDAPTIAYRVDNTSPGVLHDGDTFVALGAIDLTYKNFNPFTISVTSTETAAPDPNQKAVGDFLDALLGFSKIIAPGSEKAGGIGRRPASAAAGDEKNCLTDFKTCSSDVDAEVALALARNPKTDTKAMKDDLVDKRCRVALEECLRCGGFKAAMRRATAVVTDAATPVVTAEDLARWIRDANGRAGIRSVRGFIPAGGTEFPLGSVARKQKDVKDVIDGLTKAKEQLASLTTATDNCSSSVGTLSALFAAAADFDDVLAANKRLLASLDGIIKMLDDYASKTWRAGDAADSDLVFRQAESDAAQVKTIGLTFRIQKYAIDKDANTISGTTDVEATRSLVLRRWRRLVPEVGVAAVYNDLRYPKYATGKNEAGQLIVKKTTDSSNVDAAITMNLLCNCFGGSFLYPGLQVGVSKAKDYPGILGGIVFRFAQPKQLSFAIGRMLTWYKDLDDTLHADGPVLSDADLQVHLKRRRAPTALYLAVQYNF